MPATKPNVAELVEQMPRVDREIEAEKAAQKNPPDPNKPAPPIVNNPEDSKFTGPDPELADKICEEILNGGRASVLGLIEMIHAPGDAEFKNYKAEYLFHCLTTHVSHPGREAHRKLLVEVLVEQIGNAKLASYVRVFLIRELQLIGDKEAVNPLAKLLSDAELRDPAASALVAIGEGAPDQFRAALPNAKGRARLIIIQSLAALRDAKSTDLLQKALKDEDRDVRLAASWGVARLGDARSIEPLLKAADIEASFERVKATQACLLLAENLLAAGKKRDAGRIYTHLRTTRTDPSEQYIRDLATEALDQMGVKLS